MRIIALTDGEDNLSDISALEVAKKIIRNKVLLDSFVVGTKARGLKGITLASGGKCYFPDTLEYGLSIFEDETILSATLRE
jgi:hypothetical protein